MREPGAWITLASVVEMSRCKTRDLPRLAFALLATLASLLLSCAPAPANSTPEGAVRDFVERLEAFAGSDSDARVLYDRLSERAKANLRARAGRYGAASGKKIEPWAMLVPARSRPRFSTHSFRAQIVGKYALVDVLGVHPGEKAQIPCAYEEGAWRVDLVLPGLSPQRVRPGTEQ